MSIFNHNVVRATSPTTRSFRSAESNTRHRRQDGHTTHPRHFGGRVRAAPPARSDRGPNERLRLCAPSAAFLGPIPVLATQSCVSEANSCEGGANHLPRRVTDKCGTKAGDSICSSRRPSCRCGPLLGGPSSFTHKDERQRLPRHRLVLDRPAIQQLLPHLDNALLRAKNRHLEQKLWGPDGGQPVRRRRYWVAWRLQASPPTKSRYPRGSHRQCQRLRPTVHPQATFVVGRCLHHSRLHTPAGCRCDGVNLPIREWRRPLRCQR